MLGERVPRVSSPVCLGGRRIAPASTNTPIRHLARPYPTKVPALSLHIGLSLRHIGCYPPSSRHLFKTLRRASRHRETSGLSGD